MAKKGSHEYSFNSFISNSQTKHLHTIIVVIQFKHYSYLNQTSASINY